MVRKQRNRRYNRVALRGAVVTASLFWIGLGLYQLTLPPQNTDFDYGGIACSVAQKAMADYQGNPMPSNLSDRVAVHLSQCETCRKYRDAMMMGHHQQTGQNLTFAGLEAGARHRTTCVCGHCRDHQPTLVASR